MKVNLKTITPDIENIIVEIARVSSSRKDKTEKPEGLINYLIKNSHWSPFEHGFITFDYRDWETDRKSTRLNSSHSAKSRMPSSA